LLAELSNAKERLEDLRFPVEDLARLITLVSEDAVSLLSAKETFSIMYATGQKPDAIIAEKGFLQVSDDSALLALIDEVLAAFPLQRAEYAGGKTALLGFFVGQVMQRSKGSANPKKVGQLLLEKLS